MATEKQPCGLAIGTIELDELRRVLSTRSAEQRKALILVGAGGLSYEEVAEIYGAPLGVIKSGASCPRDRLALIYAEVSID